MDSLQSYRVYRDVVEAGGFTAAAAALGITKSAVSKHIAALEGRLGARLLDRTTRKMRPTEVGLAFYDRCARILADIEDAELAVASLHTAPRGRLRVSAPMSFGTRHLAPLLAGVLARYPELEVDLVFNDRVVDLFDEGFDLAIRIADLADSGLVARRLAPARRVVCAAPSYWRKRGKPLLPGDLAGHECLLYTYLPNESEWRLFENGKVRSVHVTGRLRANNGDALREAAIGGRGVVLAPTFIVGEDLRRGALEAALGEFAGPPLSIYAVYPQNRYLTAKVRAFIDHLAAAYGPRPYWDEGIA